MPVTSIPTKIVYGDSPACIVRFLKNKPPLVITQSKKRVVETLFLYATEKYNPKNQYSVSTIEVQYPSRILENGTVLVDTPGFGSAHIHNTMLALDSLSECDAVIFLLSAESPLTHTELEFLKLLIKKIPRIFFVLNKEDLLTQSQLAEVECFIKKTLKGYFAYKEEYLLFHVSALLAEKSIDGTVIDRANLWTESGMDSIEKDILIFMTREKYFTLAQAISDKLRDAIVNIIALLKKDKNELESPSVMLTNEESELSEALERMSNFLTEEISEVVKKKDSFIENIRKKLPEYEERVVNKIREALSLLIKTSSCDKESLKNVTFSLNCIIEQQLFTLRKDVLFTINNFLMYIFTTYPQKAEDFLNNLLERIFSKENKVKIWDKVNKIELVNVKEKEETEKSVQIKLELKWYEWFSSRQRRIEKVHQRFDKESKEKIRNCVAQLIDRLIMSAEETFEQLRKIFTGEYESYSKLLSETLNKKRETILREKEKVSGFVKNIDSRIEMLSKILEKIK